jgi:hypothetical protein
MVPTQSPENEGRKERGTKTSRTTKSPGFTVTDWLSPPARFWLRILPWLFWTSIRNVNPAQSGLQTFLTVIVPVVGGLPEAPIPVVLGFPLLTLFAAFWVQEFDTRLATPTVSHSVFCLVSCFMSLELANTVGTFAV